MESVFRAGFCCYHELEIGPEPVFEKGELMKFSEYSDAVFQKELPTITSVVAKLSKGTVHDYYSNGDYWWPNPDTEDGLPYIRRDGETNPENFFEHRAILMDMSNDVIVLYSQYMETHDERCVRRIEAILESFFLNPETMMNPSLNYAQAIPGICDGRCIGVIDTAQIVNIPFIILKLHDLGVISEDVFAGVSAWFSELCNWIFTSKLGREELGRPNNHSIAAYLQVASFALLSPDRDRIHDECAKAFMDVLLPLQMQEDGGFTDELGRTKPYSYSCFVLDIAVSLAVILSKRHPEVLGETSNGRSLEKGLRFMLPYVEDKSRWPYRKDVEHFDEFPSRMSFMYYGYKVFGIGEYEECWKNIPWPKDPLGEVARNTIVKMCDLL